VGEKMIPEEEISTQQVQTDERGAPPQQQPIIPELLNQLVQPDRLKSDYAIIPSGDAHIDTHRLSVKVINNLYESTASGMTALEIRQRSAEAAMVLLKLKLELEDLVQGNEALQNPPEEGYRHTLDEVTDAWNDRGEYYYRQVWVPEFRDAYNNPPVAESTARVETEKSLTYEDKANAIEQWAQLVERGEQDATSVVNRVMEKIRLTNPGSKRILALESRLGLMHNANSGEKVRKLLENIPKMKAELTTAPYEETKPSILMSFYKEYFSILQKGLIQLVNSMDDGVKMSANPQEKEAHLSGIQEINSILSGMGARVIDAQVGQKIDFATMEPIFADENDDPEKSETISSVEKNGYQIDTMFAIPGVESSTVVSPTKVMVYK